MFDSISFRDMIERRLTSKHLKAENANTPQIKLRPIRLPPYKFRRRIIQSATHSIPSILTDHGRTKITQLTNSLNRPNHYIADDNIFWFNISMHNVETMDVI